MRPHHSLLHLATATLLFTLLPTPVRLSAHVEAHSLLPTPVALAQTPQDRKAEADRLLKQGFQQLQTSQFEAALQSWQQALQIYREIHNRQGEGWALGNLGLAYFSQGKYAKAIEYHQQQLVIAREIHDRQSEGQALGNLGFAYRSLRNYAKAIEYHQQQLVIAREIHDRQSEGQALGNLGFAYLSLGNYAKAIEYYQQALAVAREIHDRQGERADLGGLEAAYLSQEAAYFSQGAAYFSLGNYAKAIEYYQQALAIAREIHDRQGERADLGGLGAAYFSLGNYAKAVEYYQQALAIEREIHDRKGEGAALGSLGFAYLSLGNYAKAIEYHQQQLAIAREIHDRKGEGAALGNLGLAYLSLGNYAKVVEYYQQRLVIAREIHDRQSEGRALGNLGLAYRALGNYAKAVEYRQQALVIAREIHDRKGEGDGLGNLGLAYLSLHNYAKAVEYHQQQLVIAREIHDRQSEGRALGNLGLAYRALGNNTKAVEYRQQALVIAREIHDRQSEGKALGDLGESYLSLGNYAKAFEYRQQALVIAREIHDRKREGDALGNLGDSYFSLGNYAKAIEYYQQALVVVREIHDRQGEVYALGNLGSAYLSRRNYAKVVEYYQQALVIAREIGDRESEGLALTIIGFILAEQKQPELAIFFYKQSVKVSESIRQEIRKLPREQQESYTKTIAGTYRALADLLLKQDRVLEAQQVLDLLKVQELKDYLQTVRGTGQTLYELPPEQAILQKYNALQTSAIQLGQELTALRKLPDAQRTAAQQERITKLVQLQEELNQQFNAFTDRPDVLALVKQLSPETIRQTVDLKSLDALRDDLRQLHAVLLYPLILDDRLELIITTPDSPPLRRTVNVKRDDLNAALVEFRQALQNPRSNAKLPAQKLYNWLIKPLEADLKQANAQTIIYAPDAQLRYIPLAALYDGQQWLVQRYRINNITAKSFTEFKTQPIHQPHVLAGAFTTGSYTIPVGDRSFTFAGLPFAKKEVDILAALLPNTTRLFDQAFSRIATTSKMNDYNIVHLATHASFVPGVAANSFIVFGNGDKATLKDIESWTLNQVDLVVLSACETALGGKLGNGEEILGLGYQFQNRGAKATIASLWEVSDGGTQALMDAFYGALQTGKMTKAEALRQAQIALITGDYTAVGNKRASLRVSAASQVSLSKQVNDNLNHPYYWAPFILIGNGL